MFEKFEIKACLKKDAGMAVYIAQHIYLGKKILLKTLDTAAVSGRECLARFKREARILAQLDHPNIIKVLDFGSFDHFFYISFEYFKSNTLRDVIIQRKIGQEQKIHFLKQIVCGLQYAHDHEIIHRDLKPENILVNKDDQVKIADFGLALVKNDQIVTDASSIVGTPGYMSPEQIRGEKLSGQSDLFALGIIAVELFSGQNPFIGPDIGATLSNILSFHPENQLRDVPEDLKPLVTELLKKKRAQRIDSIEHVCRQLNILQPYQPKINRVDAGNRHLSLRAAWIGVTFTAVCVFVYLWINRSGDQDLTLYNNPVEPVPAVTDSQDSAADQVDDTIKNTSVPATVAQQIPGRLWVKCSPWAKVFVNSQYVETTPFSEPIQMYPGDYQITLTHPNYPEHTKNIRIEPNKMSTFAVNLDTLYGYLVCRVFPWANISVDGHYKGQTPLSRPLALTTGEHALVIENKEYGVIENKIEITRKDTTVFTFNFDKFYSKSE